MSTTTPSHKPSKNSLVAFFASVQLALLLLILLAATSIIGTVIPQNSPAKFYADQFGPQMAKFIELLHLNDMYNSWWFLFLLLLFAINLIVCSLDRIPQVFRIVKKDPLDISVNRLQKMALSTTASVTDSPEKVTAALVQRFSAEGWHFSQKKDAGGTLLATQKGAWTRFGVYVVHISILIILAGAVIGSSMIAKTVLKNPSFAFKGSIMIPETRESGVIFSFKESKPIDLGFTIRCNSFNIAYYPNGMPKTYLSTVSILEDGKEMLTTEVKVNKPLTYKGITFYQSSYQPYQDFVINLEHTGNGKKISTVLPPAQQKQWQEEGVFYGILNQESRGNVTSRVKIWFTDKRGEPSIFWVNMGQEALIERPSGTYKFTAKQLYATGLQATKDPGVYMVYFGCILMLVGLFVAFFTSHRKLYLFISAGKANETTLLLAGSTNKNKVGFEKNFNKLAACLNVDKPA
ncbi:MAG: cytochrome C biogenesis protein ResB [Desulfobulbus propionicus]|nr:MAG: cytochrome C biogenesis protein ResB [Desulfobulbus propionicus]